MEEYQVRVVLEKKALDQKAKALSNFIGHNYLFEKLTAYEQELMKEQCETMWEYSEILGKRIELFSNKAGI